MHRFSIGQAGGADPEALARDVRRGLTAPRKSLPPKYFYDQAGSSLFEAICDTPEYYLTRSEQTILDRIAGPLLAELSPTDLIELGSGSGRKTRTLIAAAIARTGRLRWLPLDVNVDMMRTSSETLLAEFPSLTVHALVGDFERLGRLPAGERRLVAFLGSTIGNLDDEAIGTLLRSLEAQLGPHDALLVGFDLVKDREVLHRAYNDAAGVTAAFNRNVLHVINRELGGRFDPASFDHVAFYSEAASRIEMHLRSRVSQRVRVEALDLTVSFEEGETIHTESSRKFTREAVDGLAARAGLRVVTWETAPGPTGAPWFALGLLRR